MAGTWTGLASNAARGTLNLRPSASSWRRSSNARSRTRPNSSNGDGRAFGVGEDFSRDILEPNAPHPLPQVLDVGEAGLPQQRLALRSPVARQSERLLRDGCIARFQQIHAGFVSRSRQLRRNGARGVVERRDDAVNCMRTRSECAFVVDSSSALSLSPIREHQASSFLSRAECRPRCVRCSPRPAAERIVIPSVGLRANGGSRFRFESLRQRHEAHAPRRGDPFMKLHAKKLLVGIARHWFRDLREHRGARSSESAAKLSRRPAGGHGDPAAADRRSI